jgi:hypothetical protein
MRRRAIIRMLAGFAAAVYGKQKPDGRQAPDLTQKRPLAEAFRQTNREMLMRELGDLRHAMRRMIAAEDLDGSIIEERANSKPARIAPYLHHNNANTAKETP